MEKTRTELNPYCQKKQQLEELKASAEDQLAQAAAIFVVCTTTNISDTLQPDLASVHAEPNPFLKAQAGLEGKRASVEGQRAETQGKLDAIDDQLRYYDFWVEGFGLKGLKSYILDTKLGELTDAANQWVHLLTGGTIWVRFETQTMGRSTKKLSNKVNIRVFRYNPDGSISGRNYKSWSGGEKQRVSLGIDFGLSRLVARRARKSYDLLILDELFKHLDQSGREAVVDMLQILRHEKGSVIVVDHDAEFSESFENRVTVRKCNGASTIDESNSGVPGLSGCEGGGGLVEVAQRSPEQERPDVPSSQTSAF